MISFSTSAAFCGAASVAATAGARMEKQILKSLRNLLAAGKVLGVDA